MKSLVLIAAIIIASIYESTCTDGFQTVQNGCPDNSWIKYENTKCFKLIDKHSNWADAKQNCENQLGGAPTRLAIINSEHDQAFIQTFLFNTSSLVNNVWLGAARINGQPSTSFTWIGGKLVNSGYTNWAEDSPSETAGKDCVEMLSGWTKDESVGQWKDVNCATGNLAICETVQIWSPYETQLMVMKMNENPVPVGFIYTQLPNQPLPKTIWPQVQWEDVTKDYAGLFFRAEGAGSAEFGTNQGDSTRQLTAVYFGNTVEDLGLPYPLDIPSTGWSNIGRIGYYTVPSSDEFTWGYEHMQYHHSNVEVRPKNTAIRVWRRRG